MSNPIPLTHFDRFKRGIRSTIAKLQHQIEETRKSGKITNDYSLGFINGLLFCDHMANNRKGDPLFYNRTTSVGNLPKPTALNSGDPTKDTQTYQTLMDSVLLKTRLFLHQQERKSCDEVFEQMADMEKAIKDIDNFVEGDKNGRHELRNEYSPNEELQHS